MQTSRRHHPGPSLFRFFALQAAAAITSLSPSAWASCSSPSIDFAILPDDALVPSLDVPENTLVWVDGQRYSRRLSLRAFDGAAVAVSVSTIDLDDGTELHVATPAEPLASGTVYEVLEDGRLAASFTVTLPADTTAPQVPQPRLSVAGSSARLVTEGTDALLFLADPTARTLNDTPVSGSMTAVTLGSTFQLSVSRDCELRLRPDRTNGIVQLVSVDLAGNFSEFSDTIEVTLSSGCAYRAPSIVDSRASLVGFVLFVLGIRIRKTAA